MLVCLREEREDEAKGGKAAVCWQETMRLRVMMAGCMGQHIAANLTILSLFSTFFLLCDQS